jgi:hypothetical protein
LRSRPRRPASSSPRQVLEIFRDADEVTVIYTDNPEGRLEEAQKAVQANAESWRQITSGPLYRANAR